MYNLEFIISYTQKMAMTVDQIILLEFVGSLTSDGAARLVMQRLGLYSRKSAIHRGFNKIIYRYGPKYLSYNQLYPINGHHCTHL